MRRSQPFSLCFEQARGRAVSNNWRVQGLAEGLIYLDDASEALDVLRLLEKGSARDEHPVQVAWEKLKRGMAFVGTANYELAKIELSAAYSDARKANYKNYPVFRAAILAGDPVSIRSRRRGR
jgi:hypothetical protein